MSPNHEHYLAYQQGVHVNQPPLRIVTHTLRGVKNSKSPAGNADTNVMRNFSGGFYATA